MGDGLTARIADVEAAIVARERVTDDQFYAVRAALRCMGGAGNAAWARLQAAFVAAVAADGCGCRNDSYTLDGAHLNYVVHIERCRPGGLHMMPVGEDEGGE